MIYSFLGLKKPGVEGQNQHKYPTNHLPISGQTKTNNNKYGISSAINF